MAICFLYFDLGKVLVHFDHRQMIRQISDLVGLEAGRVRQVLFEDHLQADYECGRLSREGFYEAFCQRTGTRPDAEDFDRAASDFFDLNLEIVPLVAALQQAKYRMGVLSNTCPGHWELCARRFRLIAEAFPVQALSYKLGAAKPHPEMFRKAAELAGVAPGEIFFVDDAAANVEGARAAGFDAVVYLSAGQLADELRARGLRFNY